MDEEAELGRHLVLVVMLITEENPAQPAVGVHLHPLAFFEFGAVRSIYEVGDVEIDDVPAIFELQRHR